MPTSNFAGMAFDIGLDFDETRIIAGLERVQQAADNAGAAWQRLNTAASRNTATGGPAAALTKQAAATTAATASVAKFGIAAGISFGAVNLLVGGIERLARATVDFATGNVRLAASLESTQANFTTYLKSATAAKALLGELTQFAAKTPFTQGEVFGNAERLLGFGFAAEEVTDTLRRLGDISGGSAEKLGGLVTALGQVRAKQRVQGEELLQFAERGVPIYEALAKAIGKSTTDTIDLVSQGKVGFADMQKALEGLTNEGGQFAGVLENQSKTFNGLVSTLKGDFELLRAQFGTLLLPLLKDLVRATDDVIKGINVEQAAVAFQKFGDAAAPALEIIRGSIDESVIPALKTFRDEVAGVIDRIGQFIEEAGTAELGARLVAGFIDVVSLAFEVLTKAVGNTIDAIGDFTTPIINALTPAIDAVLNVLDGFVIAFDGINDSLPRTGSGFSALGNIVAAVVGVLAKGVEIFADIAAAVFGLANSARSADPLVRAFGDTVAFILTPVRFVAEGLFNIARALGETLGLLETAEEAATRAQKQQEEANRAQAGLRREQDLAGREEEAAARRADQLLETKKKKTVELAKSSKDAAKAAKDAAKEEDERTRLRIALIGDETERLLAEEKRRYDEQVAGVKRLFSRRGKVTAEGNDLLEAAAAQHAKNVDGIEGEAFTKRQEAINDRLEAEKKFIADIQKARQDEIAARRALEDIDAQIAEAQVEAYIARLRREGAAEEEIGTLSEQFDLEIKRRRLSAQIKFNNDLLATLGEGDEARRAQVEKEIQLLQAQLSNVQFELDNPEPVKVDRLTAALKRVKKDIADALGLDDDGQLDAIAQSAISAFSDLFSAFDALNSAEIDANQRAIDKIKEKVSAQEEAVERERALAEAGKANNLAIEQQRLEAILAEQRKYEEKAAELREKAAKRALLQEVASQVANTASAVAKIYNANAGIPVIGLLLAGVQIAALFAGISAARQKAKAAATERLYMGGRIPGTKTDEGGRTGHMIEGTNIMVGGGEMVVNRRVTEEHAEFLSRLNGGQYTGINMVDLMRRRDKYLSAQGATIAAHSRAAEIIANAPRVSGGSERILEAMERHHAQVMRAGWKNLLAAGEHIVDAEGNEVHYSMDLAGNKYKKKALVK